MTDEPMTPTPDPHSSKWADTSTVTAAFVGGVLIGVLLFLTVQAIARVLGYSLGL